MIATVLFGTIGFLDDYAKVRRRSSAGIPSIEEALSTEFTEPELRGELRRDVAELGVGVEEALLHDPDALHDLFHAFNEWLLDDWTFNYADLIFVMTSGGPANATQITSTYTLMQAYSNLDFGYAATLSVALLLIMLGFTIFYLRITRGLESTT